MTRVRRIIEKLKSLVTSSAFVVAVQFPSDISFGRNYLNVIFEDHVYGVNNNKNISSSHFLSLTVFNDYFKSFSEDIYELVSRAWRYYNSNTFGSNSKNSWMITKDENGKEF